MLESWLMQQASAALDRRSEAYEKIKTPEQIAAWQKERREFFVWQLGGFPERTPLNAQSVATLDRGDYRIEKVIFESEPQHHVTALLYLPKTKPPFPGVLVPCGHSANGKAAEAYQRACILLAKNGLAALCYDPIGQGERSQVLKPDGKARIQLDAGAHARRHRLDPRSARTPRAIASGTACAHSIISRAGRKWTRSASAAPATPAAAR